MNPEPIKTLVVDDDFAVAGLHRRYLHSMEGFEVVGVLERGQAVAQFVHSTAVDLVLLDVYLPDLTGLEVLAALRAAGSTVDIIMITADNERESVRRAVGHGVQDYLVKPFTVDQFTERLNAYARRRNAEIIQQPESGQPLGQEQIDRLLAAATGRATAAGEVTVHLQPRFETGSRTGQLPKGFTAPTMALVGEALRGALDTEDGTLSAAQVSERCGISRVSARRYLDFLVDSGAAQLRPRYGSAGRPEHRYRWGN